MEERSLRVYDSEKTFFSKLTNTLTKIIIPTQVGINSMLISIKRNNVLKTYENTLEDIENVEKKEAIKKKFEDVYALYLEAVDKHIMDSIYKKVKNNLVDMIDYLKKESINYNKIYSERPTLNDVFLELTGKELRD